jgi:hypothetical protein
MRNPLSRPELADDGRMETYDVVHVLAALTIGLVAARGVQALTEHYFPNSEAAVVLRFLYGGP